MTQQRNVRNVGRKAIIAEANVPRALNHAVGSTGFYGREVEREPRWTKLPDASTHSINDRLMAVMVRIEQIYEPSAEAYKALGYSRRQVLRVLQGESRMTSRFLGRAAIVSDVPYDWILVGTWDTTRRLMAASGMDFGTASPVLALGYMNSNSPRLAETSVMSDRRHGGKSVPTSDPFENAALGDNSLVRQDFRLEFADKAQRNSDFPPEPDRRDPTLPQNGPQSALLIPFYDVRASAGPGGMAVSEKPTATFPLDRSFALALGITGTDIIALTLQGDSAQPSLTDGDTILVDRTLQELRDGGLYVIGVDTDIIVKRVHRQADRSVVLRSDNPAYEPQRVSAADVERLRVIGRVRWAIRGM